MTAFVILDLHPAPSCDFLVASSESERGSRNANVCWFTGVIWFGAVAPSIVVAFYFSAFI